MDFDETLYDMIYDLKLNFYIMEKFCDFFTLRPSDLFTNFTYIFMHNFCPCFLDLYTFKVAIYKSKVHS